MKIPLLTKTVQDLLKHSRLFNGKFLENLTTVEIFKYS